MAAKRRSGFNFGADPAEMDAATYGELSGLDWEKIDSDKLTIEAISIEMIEPDFRQPRRTMPTAVRKLWKSSNLADMMLLFGNWLNLAKVETEEPLPLEKLLGAEGEGQDGSELEAEHFPIYYNLMQTTQLAAAIKRDKLKNPITVYRVGDTYKIETGERRWLAFQLLEYFYGDGHWEKIAAKVGQYDVWGQATENNQRSSLNAIGKARQFALLLMALYPDDQRLPKWKTYEECETDLEYYAQVADGDLWRIPRGKGGQILNAMGEKNVSILRHYRRVLNLPQNIWEKADDESWTLGRLREFMDVSRTPQTQFVGASYGGYSVSNDTVSGNDSSTMQGQDKGQGGHPEAVEDGYTDDPKILRQIEANLRNLELPGEQRAVAAGLYPSSTPVTPINRGVPHTQPRYKIGDYVLARGLQDRISHVRNWNAKDGQWYYELVVKAGRYAENELVLAEAPAKSTAQDIPTPSPSPLRGEGDEEEEDEYDGRDWERPTKSTECIFDRETLIRFKDMPKISENEIWNWITSPSTSAAQLRAWTKETRRVFNEAVDLIDEKTDQLEDEWKTQRREGSE